MRVSPQIWRNSDYVFFLFNHKQFKYVYLSDSSFNHTYLIAEYF